MTKTPDLQGILEPDAELPEDDVMIEKALDILDHSPNGQSLANFARESKIEIRVISTPEPLTYLPQPTVACIGFNKNHPVSPSQFVLLLAAVLREAMQEDAGITHPDFSAPRAKHVEIGIAKETDKYWYMCAVAVELNDQKAFTKYNFLDELRKMGHNETLELFLKQERGEEDN